MSLKSKVALVTGSTSGIRTRHRAGFRGPGADVVLNGFGKAEEIERNRAAIEQEFGVRAAYSAADMTKPAEIEAMMQEAQARFGSVDILVNNAAFSSSRRSRISRRQVGTDHRDQSVLRLLRDEGSDPRHEDAGMGPDHQHRLGAFPRRLAVQVGLRGGQARHFRLTKSAALELAPHKITVNCISPGYVWTPLVEAQIPDTMKARGLTKEQVIEDVMLKAQPTKEFVTVDQVAALAVFLCSDAASQMTGSNLTMDGGWTAQ